MSKEVYKAKRKRAARSTRLVPTLLFGGGLLLIFLALWAGDLGGVRTGLGQAVDGAPRLQADREKIDLGDQKLGVPVDVSIMLTNTGDGTLRFNEAPWVEVVEGC